MRKPVLATVRFSPRGVAHRWARLAAVGSILGVVFLFVATSALPAASAYVPWRPEPGVPLAPGNATLPANFTVDPNATLRTVPSAFWGLNGDAYGILNSSTAKYVGATSLHYIRWPGGRAADAYNPLTNTIYLGGTQTYSPPTNESEFVQWCQSIHCRAIQGLPGEINNPTLAKRIVNYIEHTLHFKPAYWEIGNEPAQWTHTGIPWSRWTATQAVNETPAGYAVVVQRYVTAIHSVDPTARILGLPGVGTGAWHETLWIQATVALNGPNISGVGIHVYPAGHLLAQNGTLADFFGSLNSSASLEMRVPGDIAAMRAACPSCHQLRLFATEVGSGSVGNGDTGNYGVYMAGFPQIPYAATEFIQALQLHWMSNFDYYAMKTSYPGGILDENGTPRMVYQLFSKVLNQLGPVVVQSSASSTAGGFYAVATVNHATNTLTVLFTNINTQETLHLNLRNSGAPLGGPGVTLRWTDNTGQPIRTVWSGSIPANWSLVPMSVLLIQFHL